MEEVHFSHKSVLLDECIEGLNIRPNGTYIDGTCGGAGHSYEIAKRLNGGLLIGIDQDMTAVSVARERLSPFGDHAKVVHANFREIARVCREENIAKIDGLLLDLGVSSYQLDTPERGFSYMHDAPLNMRMDEDNPLTAYDVVNTYTEEKLRKILFDYGEEKFSSRIAHAILKARAEKPIETTGELVSIIKSSIPTSAMATGHHPAKRSFQAIRIEVNGELDVIAPAIRSAVDLLDTGGRIAIITFHSLEDRIVKQTFAELCRGCDCPKSLPVCVCGKKPKLRLVNSKPILPSEKEAEENPRSRSAKLRIAERI